MCFTNICKQRSKRVVCVDHVQFLQSSLSHEYNKIPVACCKVEKYLEKPDELEELRNLLRTKHQYSIEKLQERYSTP
jgi:hypothetical protein